MFRSGFCRFRNIYPNPHCAIPRMLRDRPMNETRTLLEFQCRDHRFALPLTVVRRVMPSAQPVPLPGAPSIVLGMLNVGGETVTVINFHARVGIVFPGIDLSQQILLLSIGRFCIGMLVDNVTGIVTREVPAAAAAPPQFAGANFVESIVQLDDGLCLICDPERFLLENEKVALGSALEKIGDAKE
jgi:chemotaxis signal transduction protein